MGEIGIVDVILILVIIAIVGAAIAYIIKEKKRGVKCIGCPFAESCAQAQKNGSNMSSNCSGCNGGTCCHTKMKNNQ